MLENIFLFSLKSSVVLCILYLAYHFLFRQNTHFIVKRGLLLLIIGVSLSLPLLEFQTANRMAPESPVVQRLENILITMPKQAVKQPQQESEQAIEPVEKTIATTNNRFDWLGTAAIVYAVGVLLMFLLFLIELGKIGWILAFGEARHDLNRMAITHRYVRFPFSFWKWIFLPADLNYDDDTWQLIQEHENVHLKQGHTADVLVCTLVRCLLWFNPASYFLQKNIKDNHEALADTSILKNHDLSAYSQALLKVCLQTGSINLGHSFALKSNLSKRIKIMKTSKTPFHKSVIAIMAMLVIGFGLFTQTSVYGQQKEPDIDSVKANGLNAMVFNGIYARRYLSERHQKVFDKLKTLNPDAELRWRYLSENRILEYLKEYKPHQESHFFDKMAASEKEELIKQAFADPLYKGRVIDGIAWESEAFRKSFAEGVRKDFNYLLIYDKKVEPLANEGYTIYDMDEVDVLPEPIGGLANFKKAIALDSQLPEGINKNDLPESIDFQFVVHGGNYISEMSLVSEISGSKQKQEAIYKFIGTIHNSIRRKVKDYYSWKMGQKDGEAVNVRMVISIPTKYM